MSSRGMIHCCFVFAAMAVWGVDSAQAEIIGPYSVDVNTLHLWHLEETSLPLLDSDPETPIHLLSLGTAGNPLTQLGVASYTPPSFGNAFQGVNSLNTGIFAKPTAYGAGDDTSMATFMGADGAFTYELIVRPDFDPVTSTTEKQLFTADNDSATPNGGRSFQWSIQCPSLSSWHLRFQHLSGGGVANMLSSPITVVQGHWYHVAVTYNGAENTADNMKFYWTDMGTDAAPDNSPTVAALVSSHMQTADLKSTFSSDIAFGAGARETSSNRNNGGQFIGRMDEIRISDIARGADQFIFAVPEPSTVVLLFAAVFSLVFYARRR